MFKKRQSGKMNTSELKNLVRNSLPWWLRGKESTCNAGDAGWIPGWWRSPGEGSGRPLQYSCLETSMDGGPWGLQSPGLQLNNSKLSTFTFFWSFGLLSVYVCLWLKEHFYSGRSRSPKLIYHILQNLPLKLFCTCVSFPQYKFSSVSVDRD